MTLRVAILTISDRSSRGERDDLSGPAIIELILKQKWIISNSGIIPDNVDVISSTLNSWCESGENDLILTTGGTGFSSRDVTPEATLRVVERQTPGLTEVMRAEGLKHTPFSMLSRAVAGIKMRTLIINLPGSPKGAVENLAVILSVLPHAVDLLKENPSAEKGHNKY
jgi:molybdopterin adenylyltransferase